MPPYLDEAEWTNWAQRETNDDNVPAGSYGTSAFSPQGTLTRAEQRANGPQSPDCDGGTSCALSLALNIKEMAGL